LAGVTRARYLLLGAKTPWKRVRLTRGFGTRAASITKTGNTHARKALIEAAWQYRRPPHISRNLLLRQQRLHQSFNTIAWQAQLRLYQRYRTLRARGKCSQKVVVAIARELAAFVWAIARQAQALA
jgi:hypothetical protein